MNKVSVMFLLALSFCVVFLAQKVGRSIGNLL